MKRYISCFLFFLVLTGGCLIALFLLTVRTAAPEDREVQVPETFEEAVLAEETGKTAQAGDRGAAAVRAGKPGAAAPGEESGGNEEPVHIVLNQERVEPMAAEDGQYYLVAEEGYLLVYEGENRRVNLFTHMPLAEFPLKEQERLMEGIWFSTMAEIFSYLESYSS